jgi:hypothetical protein
MPSFEVSRTLVKSPPELWAELGPDRLARALGDVQVTEKEPERELAWTSDGVSGTARLEPSSWGTKVTLTAEVDEVEEEIAEHGIWARILGREPEPPPPRPHVDFGRKLEELLDELGSAHRKPFARE